MRQSVRPGVAARSFIDNLLPFPMQGRMWGLIRTGDFTGRYASRSEVVQAIVTAGVYYGWEPRRIWLLLMDPSNRGGDWLRTRRGRPVSIARAERDFARCWSKAETFVATHPPFRDRTDALLHIADVLEHAEGALWTGKGGASDRAVLEALILVGLKTGKVCVDASVRRLGEDAGVGSMTAARALRRLEAVGWVRRAGRHTYKDAATWRLAIPKGAQVIHTELPEDGENVRITYAHTLSHDVWRWRTGLGKTKARVYATLLPLSEQSPTDLARRLGTSVSTVRRHLLGMESHDLASRGPAGGWLRGAADLDDVVASLGGAGVGAVQRDTNERARRQRRDAIADWLSEHRRERPERATRA